MSAGVEGRVPALRRERHFGRAMTCYAERPADAFSMLRAWERPEGDAVVEPLPGGAARLSHAELHRAAAGLAAGLSARGLRAGDRVALLLGNRRAFAVAVVALLRAGLVAVPIGTRSQRPEIAHAVADSGARAILHDAALADRLPEGTLAIDADGPDLAAMLEAPPAPPHPAREEDVAAILYTSGTTGRPKGAMLTHLGLVHSALHYAHAFDLGPRDRSLMAVPASHVTGLVANLVAILGAGGALLILPRFDVADCLALARAERMSHTVLVPAMYELLLRRADLARAGLDAWRVGAYGGAPMPEATIARLARALPGLALANVYGATETTSPATIMPLGETGRPDSVGRVVPCGEIRVTDAAGREVPPGEPGEIRIAGPMVSPGYWGDPARTAEAFEDGWRSGDVGSLDAAGYLRVLDRIKDVINRGGHKVYSAEVEGVLAQHEAVAEAAVVPLPCPVLGERVHAVVRPHEGARLDAEALRAFCAERLSDYKVPEGFTVMAEPLPRNAGGKLAKRDIRALVDGGQSNRRETTT